MDVELPMRRRRSAVTGTRALIAAMLASVLLAACDSSASRDRVAAVAQPAATSAANQDARAAVATNAPVRGPVPAPGSAPRATADGPPPAPSGAPAAEPRDAQPSGIVFESAWSTATGATREAVTDGGRWPVLACGPVFDRVLSVVPGAPLDFPEGGNVLKVRMSGENCGMLQREDVVPASTTHWGRFWIRNDEHGNKNDHPVAYYNVHPAAPIQAVPFVRYANNLGPGQWQAGLYGDSKYPTNRWYSPPLMNGVWYRYEWEMRYLSATTFQVWPRIYSASGQLLYTAANYTHEGGGLTLEAFWRSGVQLTLGGGRARPDLARHFGMGNEGPGGASDSGGSWYYAKFALSTAGWIGR